MLYRILISILLAFSLSSQVLADWITEAVFSEKADIDSIERFLVIPDSDTNTIFGRPIINLGDINSDGGTDIIIMREEGSHLNIHHGFLFYGGILLDSLADEEYTRFKPLVGNIGDFNRDGYVDIGSFHYPDNQFDLFLGGPLLDDSPDFFIPKMFSRTVRVADLDNDEILDLPLSSSINGGFVYIYQVSENLDTFPEYIIADTSTDFGRHLETGDFNGDSFPDLAISAPYNRDSSFVKFYWGGPEFDTIADYEIYSFASSFGSDLINLGDFNADGSDDLYIGGGSNGRQGIFFCGDIIDNELDIMVNEFIYGGYYTPVWADRAGDINNDDYPDFILGYTNPVFFVNEIKVFLGGPDADSVIDIYIENLMVPGGQMDFGMVVAGIGDFNGDGIDDFAVSSRTADGCCWTGEVNFFAGWDSKATAVDNDNDLPMPEGIELNQNYPNPFNPSTTIKYSLPKKADIRLNIYDILGRHIVTLVNNTKSAGEYEIIWDGKDALGKPVSSGIYFYCLEADGVTESRKMILLK
jgi:hypothetical protein